MKFSIIGGDLRALYIYYLLKDEGHVVKIGGFDNFSGISFDGQTQFNIDNLSENFRDSEIIIGPTPCLGLNRNLNSPHSKEIITFESVIDELKSNQIFIAGRIPNDKQNYAESKNIRTFDILEREEMSILNAIPTAEGAISIAIEKSKITLFDSNIMVMGFGRVGKILAKMLYGIGAKVFVLARNITEQSYAKAFGYNVLDFDNFDGDLNKMDIIINTIPSNILNSQNLILLKKDCVLIELASKPFGIDAEFCRENGLNITFAPSLPGKVAPISAAKYIVQTIKNIIKTL